MCVSILLCEVQETTNSILFFATPLLFDIWNETKTKNEGKMDSLKCSSFVVCKTLMAPISRPMADEALGISTIVCFLWSLSTKQTLSLFMRVSNRVIKWARIKRFYFFSTCLCLCSLMSLNHIKQHGTALLRPSSTFIFDTDDHHIKLCVFVNVQGNAIPTWQKSFFTIHSIDSLR